MRHPLDTPEIEAIWLEGARELGFSLVRTHEAYASSDGLGRISIGARETLDDDDCYAQLVFHELCHAIVQGEANLSSPDWGLDNINDDDLDQEQGCLRVQAHLAHQSGLRDQMVPTTDVRVYYLQLPNDALAGNDAGAVLANRAIATPLFRRWLPVVRDALERTATELGATQPASRS